MVYSKFIGGTVVYTTSVLHEYGAEAFFKEQVTRQWYFFAMISNGASRFFCNNFHLHRQCSIINFALSLSFLKKIRVSSFVAKL